MIEKAESGGFLLSTRIDNMNIKCYNNGVIEMIEYKEDDGMNKVYKDMYTTENIEAIGGIDNMNRWVKEMQKNDMRIKRNKFLDSAFTLILDAALIYGIVILSMRIFL